MAFDDYGRINTWVGWNTTKNSDKIWGLIPLEEHEKYYSGEINFLIFWGRRGGPYSTKITAGTYYNAEILVNSKKSKGYNRVTQYEKTCEGLTEDIEKLVLWAKFKV